MCILTLYLFSSDITKLLWWLSSLNLRQCTTSLLLCSSLIPLFEHEFPRFNETSSRRRGMIVPVLSLLEAHHGHTIRIVYHDTLEVEIVSLEVLRFVHNSTLQSWELIIDWYLVAFYHPLSVIRVLALLCVVDEVLVIDSVLLDYKITNRWKRSLIKVVNEVDHQRPVIFLLLKHLENEFLQLGTVAGMNWLGIFILDRLEERVHGFFIEWGLQASHMINWNS